MHFEGRRDVHRSQSNEPFNPLDEMTGLVCNHCGYKQKEEHRTLHENLDVVDRVDISVTKADPDAEDKQEK